MTFTLLGFRPNIEPIRAAGVRVAAGTIFTNDRFARATTADLRRPWTSAPDEHTLPTLVREVAAIGAGCIVGSDLSTGRFSMIGMTSVITRPISDCALSLAPSRQRATTHVSPAIYAMPSMRSAFASSRRRFERTRQAP